MKRVIFAFLFLSILSCTVSEGDASVVPVSATIESSSVYKLDLGNQPVEGSVSITKDAQHASISEIKADEDSTGGLVYLYRSQENFTGTEIIEIERKGSIGGTDFFLEATYRIELTIVAP